jgi:murein L,D-transpeptidase YafK
MKADRIVVSKARKRLFLFQGQKAVGSYPVALGKQAGPKTAQGDLKTPEGRYENCRLMRTSTFYKAILITYPNPQERQKGYTGGAIEIHGLPRLPYGLENFAGSWIIWLGYTEGCIMVTNRHMDEIIAAVKFPVTVEIQP